MFFMLFMMFVLFGSMIMMLDIMIPDFFIPMVAIGLRIMGLCMIWTGVIIYAGRAKMTGADLICSLANPNQVLAIHERRGGSARIRRGILDVLEHIKLKDMIFKDTGGGFRIAGHRVVLTKETVSHNIPEVMAQYMYQLRQKYMVENQEQLKILYDKLKGLKRPDIVSIERQLEMIPELNVVMQDKNKKQMLLNMSLQDLQQMAELLYNGQIIHFEDYERFQEAAAPYDLESYVKRREAHRILQMIHYRDINAPDWMKYVIIIFIMFILGAIAYTVFKGG